MNSQERNQIILERLAIGLRPKEIGQILTISSRTVEAHIAMMRANFGAKNVPHLIHLAHERGVLTSKK